MRQFIDIISEAHVPSSPEFKAWFSGSKVTKANGEPLCLLRGVVGDHDHLSPDIIFFTDDPELASEFAGVYPDHSTDPQPETGWHGGRVYTAYLKMTNPYIDTDGDWEAIERPERIAELKASGHDGFITSEGGATTYAVFSKNQVWPEFKSS